MRAPMRPRRIVLVMGAFYVLGMRATSRTSFPARFKIIHVLGDSGDDERCIADVDPRHACSAKEWKRGAMSDPYGANIYTEPASVDKNTLANLGPLTGIAGVWEGRRGLDVNPKEAGPERQVFIERIELQPIDPQTNGPQLFYGLRYHTHIVKPGEVETYHDQVGYWLWEPATGNLIQTLTIPRGQTAMAFGRAAKGDRRFELIATRGSVTNGICSNPFLEEAFRTDEYRIRVTIDANDSWSYEEETTLLVRGQPFHHTDRSVFKRIAPPTPNPLAAP